MTGKKGEIIKTKYPQPHNIDVPKKGNPALEQRQRDKIHATEKRKARYGLTEQIKERYGENTTKKQIKIIKRREESLYLAKKGKLYCSSYERYLCVRDVKQKKCYVGHRNNPPFCPYLKMEIKNGNIVQFRMRGLVKRLS